MIDSQPLKVSIEFNYKANLFEGDPTDSYEIAGLEHEYIAPKLEDYIMSLIGSARDVKVSVKPA